MKQNNSDLNQSIVLNAELINADYDTIIPPLQGVEYESNTENVDAAIKYGIISQNDI